MKKIGEVLQEQRLKRQIPLEKISQITKIKVEFLNAIEANDFDALPSAPFVKGFIQAYARCIGLDPNTTLALLRRDFKTSEAGQLIPRDFLKPVSRQKRGFTPQMAMKITAVGVVMLVVGFVYYEYRQLNKPPELELYSPELNAEVEKNIVVSGHTDVDAVVLVDDQPVAITAEGEFETTIFTDTTGPYVITIRAQDRKKRETKIIRTVNVKPEESQNNEQ